MKCVVQIWSLDAFSMNSYIHFPCLQTPVCWISRATFLPRYTPNDIPIGFNIGHFRGSRSLSSLCLLLEKLHNLFLARIMALTMRWASMFDLDQICNREVAAVRRLC